MILHLKGLIMCLWYSTVLPNGSEQCVCVCVIEKDIAHCHASDTEVSQFEGGDEL